MLPFSKSYLAIVMATGISTVAAQDVNNQSSRGAKELALEIVNVYGRHQNDTLKTIPQTVSLYDEETFDIGLFDTVGDVLRLVPTASRSGSSQDMFADDYLFRGFNAEQSTNGLGFTQTDHPTDLANVERIEVLKGPSAVLYGQMEPGGTINVVTKQPLSEFQGALGFEVGSYGRKRSTLDVTGPISDSVRARLNVAYQDSDSFIDFLGHEHLFIAPNVAIDLSDKTELTIEGSVSRNEWAAINGGTPVEGAISPNPNGDYDKDFNPAGKDSFTERNSENINIRLTHDVTDRIQARASYTYLRNDADFREQAPFGLDADLRTLNRIVFAGVDSYKKDHNFILDISGELETGSLSHRFTAGLDYRSGNLSRPTQIYFIDPIDLYDPQYGPVNLNDGNLGRDRTLRQDDDVAALFLQNRITITEQWHLLAGLRYIDSEQSQETFDNLNTTSSIDEISQTDWTTQFGIVYDLSDATSLYANRSESFVPQQGTTSGAKPLEAEEGVQYEAGLRIQVGGLSINAAGFLITKDNIAIEDPLDDDFEVAKGRARSKGVELSVGGYVNANWYLAAAYGFTDTEILRSDDPELEGKPFVNVPKRTFSLQSRYSIVSVPGLSVGGTVTYLSERAGDSESSFELPAYTLVDAGVYYTISESLQLDVLVDNAFDEEYFSPGSFSGVVREPERTYLARLKYRF
ncbi:TonB-dependent siderophore receptor [Zhongshania sp. BJYM1]|uniref:TonB-dependent siderophore receptor n=1 Tax=Zhongshania aquatica TaxID=2965069 RepID=UPI0022B45D86|nr:TonB-dependent siderophore receptor [Marortus sp. BJYM1]